MKFRRDIFISYRRSDTGGWTQLLYSRLDQLFPKNIFKDTAGGIEAGAEFPEALIEGVLECYVMIVVIGPDWDNEENSKRLQDSRDWVRREICLAEKKSKLIIPVCIARNHLPNYQDYQSWGFDLSTKNHVELNTNDGDWERPLNHLKAVINKHAYARSAFSTEGLRTKIRMLNRERQVSQVMDGIEDKQCLFSAVGNDRCGFDDFVKRLTTDAEIPLQNITVKRIEWGSFCYRNKRVRKKTILKKIAESVSVPSAGREEADLKQELQTCFNHQPFIFFTTRRGQAVANHHRGAVADWWQVWDELLHENSSQTRVFLCSVANWRSGLNFYYRWFQPENLVILKSLSRLKKTDVVEWQEQYVINKQEAVLFVIRKALEKTIQRLFRFLPRRCFKEVAEHLEEAILDQ